MYASNASNDFDKIFFQELLCIINAHRARKNKDENDVFSKRSDHDVSFEISLNEFNLIK
jgi:hypothetical protein